MYIYETLSQRKPLIRADCDMRPDNTYPWTSTVALLFDNQFETARFQRVKHKASSKRLSIYSSHPFAAHKAWLRYEIDAKLNIIFLKALNNQKKLQRTLYSFLFRVKL